MSRRNTKVLAVIACLAIAAPVYAQKADLKPALVLDQSKFEEPTFKDQHPKLYRFSKPVRVYGRFIRRVGRKLGVNQTLRVVGDSAIWLGKKTEPYQPFLNLTTSVTNAAVSTGVWFK